MDKLLPAAQLAGTVRRTDLDRKLSSSGSTSHFFFHLNDNKPYPPYHTIP